MESIDPKEARELGMDRRISRRDFLNGITVGAATTLVVMDNGEPAIAQQSSAGATRSALPAGANRFARQPRRLLRGCPSST
jgi:hypothetical protein